MVFLAGCSGPQKKLIGMPNPASVHCIDQGGISKMEKDAFGNTYGVCVFKDNRQCGEWALFRGECPPGGVNVKGHTKAESDCMIRGGSMKNKTCVFYN